MKGMCVCFFYTYKVWDHSILVYSPNNYDIFRLFNFQFPSFRWLLNLFQTVIRQIWLRRSFISLGLAGTRWMPSYLNFLMLLVFWCWSLQPKLFFNHPNIKFFGHLVKILQTTNESGSFSCSVKLYKRLSLYCSRWKGNETDEAGMTKHDMQWRSPYIIVLAYE